MLFIGKLDSEKRPRHGKLRLAVGNVRFRTPAFVSFQEPAMSQTSSARSHRPESPEAPPPAAGGAGGRDANGRFTAGNHGGPGNPFARRIAEFRRAIVDAATPEKIVAVVAKLEEKALAGDVAAAKLYLSYAVGKPGPAPDPDRLGVDEGRLMREEVEAVWQAAKAVDCPLLELLLTLVRSARDVASDRCVQQVLDGCAARDAAEQAPPSANGDNGDVPSPQAAEPPVMPPPSANGDNGGNPARAGQPPRGMESPGGAAPTANGANGDGDRHNPSRGRPRPRRRRPDRWVPPWEEGGGVSP
jgi:hypothetical protein